MTSKNRLYYGDNLDVLRRHIQDESVDLVYLDPPFNSNASYNVLFADHGAQSAAQIHAFEDTWHWDEAAAYDYEQTVERGGKVADALRAFRTLLGTSDMLAYLSMMAPRLVELRRVMKPTASIYLHCDPTASHYLKLLMDAIFGASKFRNEVVWYYRRYTASSHNFQALHDTILRYTKTDHWTFNDIREPYSDTAGTRDAHYKQDESGKWYRWQKRAGKEPYKIYLNTDGKRAGDVWAIQHINASAAERLGYPTQKPLALLERVITASSDVNDVVLDPFCGCGTTVAAAQALNRQWIGIDITHLAIGLIKHRLADTYGPEITSTYEVIGEPTDVDGARQLGRDDPFQFQAWALGLVGARIANSAKKGGDRGIDGRLYFHDEPGGQTKQIVFSVKAGHLVPAFVRDLEAVVDREKAQIGVLLSLDEPTSGMRAEAAGFGFYESPWGTRHPRLQMLTVGQLLEGKRIDYPAIAGANVTFKRAARASTSAESLELDYGDQPN